MKPVTWSVCRTADCRPMLAVNDRPAPTARATKPDTSGMPGKAPARPPPQRSLGRQPWSTTRRTPSSQSDGAVGVGTARLDDGDDVLGHELGDALEPDRVDVVGRRHLDRAGVEQGRPRRGQRERLGDAAEAGVDRERDGDGAGGPALHQLRDELGEPGHRDHQRAEQTAVVGGARREVLVDHRRHGRARALGHERRIVDDRAEQRRNTVDRCPAGLGDGGHVRTVAGGPGRPRHRPVDSPRGTSVSRRASKFG